LEGGFDMIEKIDINQFGPYKNYEWKKSVGNDEHSVFKELNIIYGRNYSGKTTLSRIFRCVENGYLHPDYPDADFKIYFRDGSTITHDNLNNHSNKLKIRVYNTDFVRTNLSWFFYDDGSIKPFTILGEKNVEIEKQLDDIRSKLGSVAEKKGLLYELEQIKDSYSSKQKEEIKKIEHLDNILRKKAQEIKNTSDIYNVPTYNINSIKSDISHVIHDTTSYILSENDINIYKRLLKEEAKIKINKIKSLHSEFSYYLETTNKLISRKIRPSEPIMELINDSLLQEWVRDGIEKHRGKREKCAFCGNYINNDLWDKLDAHFSKESEDLRKELIYHIHSLDQFKKEISDLIKIDKNNIYVDLHSMFDTLMEKWNTLKENYIQNIDLLISELNKREKDIFKERHMIDGLLFKDDINELINNFNRLIDLNNQKTSTLKADQESARLKLRLNEIVKFLKDIDYTGQVEEINRLKKEASNIKPFISDKDEEIQVVLREKIKLETQLQDESRGAELVNKHLTNFFGHDELKLVAEGEKPNIKFKIYRDGIEAKNLSEGECSLISFCYFIAQIEDELKDHKSKEILIIYIDDPISSLDGNHIFFMFSLIESIIAKNKNYLQLFISTHNLDFLKYLKRLTRPNGNDSVNHFLIERKMKQNCKASFLVKMPVHIKEYVTEFNYLFNEIYSLYKQVKGDRKSYLENTYNQFYNLPNNIRKFLECYLFYKYPNNLTPLDNLHKMFDGNVPSLLNRVINEYSHLVYIDRGWKPVDVDEMEKCVEIIIEKMKQKDPEQFHALLESIGIKTTDAIEIG
jgi:wobble nucleotide-excising tRNase